MDTPTDKAERLYNKLPSMVPARFLADRDEILGLRQTMRDALLQGKTERANNAAYLLAHRTQRLLSQIKHGR